MYENFDREKTAADNHGKKLINAQHTVDDQPNIFLSGRSALYPNLKYKMSTKRKSMIAPRGSEKKRKGKSLILK